MSEQRKIKTHTHQTHGGSFPANTLAHTHTNTHTLAMAAMRNNSNDVFKLSYMEIGIVVVAVTTSFTINDETAAVLFVLKCHYYMEESDPLEPCYCLLCVRVYG